MAESRQGERRETGSEVIECHAEPLEHAQPRRRPATAARAAEPSLARSGGAVLLMLLVPAILLASFFFIMKILVIFAVLLLVASRYPKQIFGGLGRLLAAAAGRGQRRR